MTSSSAEVIDLGRLFVYKELRRGTSCHAADKHSPTPQAARPQAPAFSWAVGLATHPAGYTKGR